MSRYSDCLLPSITAKRRVVTASGRRGFRAAGIAHRRIYDLRHTYATWSLGAGVDLFTLSRRMGTSLAMIDATYGHLAPDADERERILLDTYDAAAMNG